MRRLTNRDGRWPTLVLRWNVLRRHEHDQRLAEQLRNALEHPTVVRVDDEEQRLAHERHQVARIQTAIVSHRISVSSTILFRFFFFLSLPVHFFGVAVALLGAAAQIRLPFAVGDDAAHVVTCRWRRPTIQISLGSFRACLIGSTGLSKFLL